MNTFTFATPDYTPHARAERLIAAGRAVLAFSSIAAIYLEPSTPAKYAASTYTLLTAYATYALVIAIHAWRSPVPSRRMRLVSHASDLVLFSIFILLTEGPASPFFLYFSFSLFCATLRFSWRGILATGVAAMSIYAAMAIAASFAGGLDLSRVLTRVAYLGVIAALLVYLGVYQQQLRAELASLAAWPRELAAKLDELLRLTLAHAAGVLGAERVVLLWEEHEEPWTWQAVWTRGEFRLDRVAPTPDESIASDALRGTSFFMREQSASTLVYDPRRSTAHEWTGRALGNATKQRLGIDSAIGVSFQSETLSGCLLVAGVRNATADDLALAHVAGRLVVATLEQFFFVQQARQTASADERLRISRELHDGIVQSLGGVGLQLQSIRAQVRDGTEAAERIKHVQQVIEHDQRELRAIVRELRPHDVRSGGSILEEELRRIRERFPLEWGLAVDDQSTPVDVPAPLAQELCRIVNESLSNAARHGSATRATVALSASNGSIQVRVSDNGRGFPFAGRYDLAALDRAGYGPRTLKERVAALGGSLTIESSPNGATIEALVPLAQEALA